MLTPGPPHEIGGIYTGQWRGPGVAFSEVAGLRRLRSGGCCLAGPRISPRREHEVDRVPPLAKTAVRQAPSLGREQRVVIDGWRR